MKRPSLLIILSFVIVNKSFHAEIISPPLWEKAKPKEIKVHVEEMNQSKQKYEERPATKRMILLNENLNPSGDPSVETEIRNYQVLDSSSDADDQQDK